MTQDMSELGQLAEALEALAGKISDQPWLVYDMRYVARVMRHKAGITDGPDAFKYHYERDASAKLG